MTNQVTTNQLAKQGLKLAKARILLRQDPIYQKLTKDAEEIKNTENIGYLILETIISIMEIETERTGIVPSIDEVMGQFKTKT